MNLTKEQELIVNSEKDIMFVSAMAGTGKTTTLLEFTKKRPFETFLYIVYNKSMRKRASQIFPQNVVVHTIHSLAYSYIGKHYKHKLSKNNISLKDIIDNLDYFKNLSYETKFEEASKIKAILEDMFLNVTIYPYKYNSKYFKLANEYYNKMIDIESPVKITHDAYLKVFFNLNIDLKYKYILIDEAQDMNGIMYEIIKRQKSKKIFVGDPLQSIYGYRNLINVFNKNKSDFTLTQSFRFGEEIALIVNLLIKHFNKSNLKLKGNTNQNSSFLDFSFNEKYTFLTRTNARAFDIANMAIQKGKQVALLGDKEVFDLLEDVFYLYQGDLYKITNPYIKSFLSFEHLKKIANNTADPELRFLVKVQEKYKNSLGHYLKRLKNKIINPKYADIIVSTTHKAKGLEFEQVRLADDFVSLRNKNGKFKKNIDNEEFNILYVALTRAKKNIKLNKELEDLIFSLL